MPDLAGGGDSSPGAAGPAPSPPHALSDEAVTLGKTVVKNFHGKPWRMQASEVDWDEGKRGGVAEEVRWDLLDADGEVTVIVTAPQANFDMERERVDFVGQVVAHRPDEGDRVTVNHLIWLGKEEKFYGSEGVRWTRAQDVLEAERLVADSTFTEVELEGEVRGRTWLQGGSP